MCDDMQKKNKTKNSFKKTFVEKNKFYDWIFVISTSFLNLCILWYVYITLERGFAVISFVTYSRHCSQIDKRIQSIVVVVVVVKYLRWKADYISSI